MKFDQRERLEALLVPADSAKQSRLDRLLGAALMACDTDYVVDIGVHDPL